MTTRPVSEAPLPANDRGPALVPRGLIVLLGLSSAVVTAAGISLLAWLIGPVFLSLIIVLCVSPVQGWLRRRGMPHWLATAALVIGVYAVLVALLLVMVVSVAQLGSLLPQYADRIRDRLDDITALLAQAGIGQQQLDTIADTLDPAKVGQLVGSILSSVGGLASNLVFLLSLLLFLSLENRYSGARLAMIAEDRPLVARAIGDFARGTRSYMVVTTVFGVITGVVDGVVLALLGVPLPALWGLLAFLTNYIPNIGFLIGLIPPALLALLSGGWQLMVVVIIIYVGINFVLESLIQPRFIGNAVGLSTTVTFIALLFWAWMIGPLGAILAIPLTLLAKALLIDIDPRARWAGVLIGSRNATVGPAAKPG